MGGVVYLDQLTIYPACVTHNNAVSCALVKLLCTSISHLADCFHLNQKGTTTGSVIPYSVPTYPPQGHGSPESIPKTTRARRGTTEPGVLTYRMAHIMHAYRQFGNASSP